MQLEGILQTPAFHLPAVNSSGQPYVVFAERVLKDYAYAVRSSSADLFKDAVMTVVSFKEFCDTVDLISEGLIEVIRLSKAGDTLKMSEKFSELMDEAGIFLANHKGAMFFIDPSDVFYRCKFDPTTKALKPQEYFFHTPFELDYLVKGTRFAPPGYPAIYLANSMIGGYAETRASDLVGFQGVKMEFKKPYGFLDMDYTKPSAALKTTDRKAYDLQLQAKGIIFPLLFSCYSQQNKPGAAAAQEYIIPQLLLKWVKENNKMISGIKYSCTRTDHAHYRGTFYNLILPPQQISDTGYCPKLKKMFRMSQVCGYEQDLRAIHDYYHSSFHAPVNPEVEFVDWNSAMEDYDINEVGKMEYFIKNELATAPIPF